ncbi:MAG TPA: rhodanese-like domain-containing protein, partial [Solirubrobacteraceae bacterium]|nr:rhodanese-like domain-containing protein [Solirubrobacteraceae bacterium]
MSHEDDAGATDAERGRDADTIDVNPERDADTIDVDPGRVAGWIASEPPAQVIDVREPYEREAGRIEGSRHIELVALTGEAGTIDRDRPVIFYCRVGARSTMAAQAFRAAGYEAYSMTGGLVRWASEGRPLEPEGGRVA